MAAGAEPAENLFIGLKDVIDAGKVYAEDTDRMTDKLALYACADQYVDALTFQPTNKEKISEYHACLRTVSESEYAETNKQFVGFEPYLIQYEDEEEYNKRWAITKLLSKTTVKLPHPLALLKKAAEDLGKFAFVNAVDEQKNYKPRDRFVVTIKDAMLLVLDRQKYGKQTFETKLKEKLAILADLCAKNTVFQKDELADKKDEQLESEYSSETLIDLGQKIGSILASAGGQHVLPYEERIKLGVEVAQVLFPVYSSILRANAEGKDLKLGMSELVKLGDEEIQSFEKNKGSLEGDFDAKFYAISMILFQLNKLQESKSTKSVKKAEFKEKNPLENAFVL